MEIVWYGLGAFRINERSYPAIFTDPFSEEEAEYEIPRVRVELVALSTPHEDPRSLHWTGFRGKQHTLASPGEYEVGGLFVTGVASYSDRKKGAERGENIIYTFDIKGMVVCYLGDLGHVPTQSQIEAIGPVDVLLVPVGVPGALTPAKASEVASLIEPHIIVPMNYKTPGIKVKRNTVGRFLKEMGITEEQPQPSLKLSSRDIPEETEVILLEPQQG